MTIEISASLDPAVGKNLEGYLQELNNLEYISIHCDIMRSDFVTRNSVNAEQYLYILKNSKHPVDVHIMANSIELELRKALKNHPPRSLSVHIESQLTKEYNSGLVIDLDTENLDGELIKSAKVITVMSVKAGASGQKFNSSALEKIKIIKNLNKFARIILDGGINSENIAQVKNAGVDTAVVGSYLYNTHDKKATLELLQG